MEHALVIGGTGMLAGAVRGTGVLAALDDPQQRPRIMGELA